MRAQIDDLLHRMNVTKGARFNAARRLEGRDRKMALLVALASALVIALTFVPFAYQLPKVVIADLSVVTMLASVLILAVSLVQYSNNDAVNAEQHHRCGLEINELRGELAAKGETLDSAELQRFSERYARILDRYSVNHEGLDFDQYRLEHPEKYPLTLLERVLVRVRSFIVAQWPNGLMLIIVGFFFVLLFHHVLPVRLATETTPVPSTVVPGER
ncbi:SLATT domain-containing protein [Bradyrhizobium frederickii]|uniref:SLATT domain-containing protein n=1 Tax=Bradyrhizobium frederickii TaxID=2560054 RepID=A0A4Y9P179_9BRAD|nr:SLATT domain-containing protein [Bradyrhizobium frederickii]TFV74100.1 SLATT domain-containing protein [Bradyrhizobium frederickii]